MKKKSKNAKTRTVLTKLSDFGSKDEKGFILKKSIEHIRKFKSPDLQLTKDTRLTRRAKSPQLKLSVQRKSKDQFMFETPVKSAIKSMKHTPNKSLAGIENSMTLFKDKVKTKIPTKMTSEGKQTGHRKTKSQQIILNKQCNYDLFVPRNSAQKTVVKSYSHRTKAGILDGKTKINQDSLIVQPYYLTSQSSLFGVCDGHGINGHQVSELVRKNFPSNLEFFLMKNQLMNRKQQDFETTQYSLKMAFKKTACDLLMSDIDIDFSGSTCVLVFIFGKNIWCSNIGDSRAVLFSQMFNSQLNYTLLSHDHKGENPIQAKRIIGMGGKLQSYLDEDGQSVGPLRVWIPDKDIPGLAMTRAFGDYLASTVGVTSDPQIIYHKIKKDDQFLVIASDGLWQFITPQIVGNIVKQYYHNFDSVGACKALQKVAIKAWQQQDQIIDDITIIVVFFDN